MTKKAPLPAIIDLFRSVDLGTKHHAILRPFVEVLLWGSLGLAVAFGMLAYRPAPLSNDSYQYLSVAANIRNGNGIATDLVYFDTERTHGRIPAPLTTFPPGYPAAVGLLSCFAVGYEMAARILSSVCFAGTAALLAFVLIAARVTAFVRTVVLLLFVTNVVSIEFSTAALTESMFVFIFTAAIVALLWADWDCQHPRAHLPWIIAGFILAGLSFWVRYAGLFLIAGVMFYGSLRFLKFRRRVGASELFAALIPIGLAGALMARNVLLVGNWKGGNQLQASNPMRGVLADFVRAQLHLLLGEHAVKFGVWEGLLLVGGLSLCVQFGRILLKAGQDGSARLSAARYLWTLPLTCAAVYSVAMCYAGLRTVISFGTRMFLPVLPLYILLFGLVLNWLISRVRSSGGRIWFRAALCMLAIGYIGVNARDLGTPRAKTGQASLSALFAEHTADGQPMSAWISAHIPSAAVIAAQDGQATGYLLHRRTLGLVESEYSAERWECPEIRKQMNDFGASYLILYRFPDNNSHLLNESSFAATAATGQPGCGFVIASESKDVRILEIEPSPEAGGSR